MKYYRSLRVFLVIALLALVIGCGTSTTSTKTSTTTQINATIYNVLERGQVAYIESVKLDDGSYGVLIFYYFNPSLLQEDYLQVLSESTNLFKEIFTTIDKVNIVAIGVLQTYNDEYGQQQEKGLAATLMTRDTAEKIKWGSFRSEDLDKVAEVKYYGSSIFTDLNDLQSALNEIQMNYAMQEQMGQIIYPPTIPYPELAADEEYVETDYGDIGDDEDNLALGKTVTGSVSNYNVGGLNQVYSRVTDGNLDPDVYGESSENGAQWIMVNLGSTVSISKIKLWNYYKDGRRYYGNKVEVSSDGKSWVTVFDSDTDGTYTETSEGKEISFESKDVRYIRSWLDGSSVNSGNHWVELAAYE